MYHIMVLLSIGPRRALTVPPRNLNFITLKYNKLQEFAHRPLDIVSYVVYNTHMMTHFGEYLRQQREKLRENNPEFSLRKIAVKIGVEPSYLSKVERCEQPPPSEAKIALLAEALGEDADVLLALAGKVSSDLQKVIRQRPKLFAELIREMKDMPDHAVLRLVREVRDGKW